MLFYYTVPRYMMTKDFPQVPVLYSAGSWWVKQKLVVPLWVDRVESIIVDCGSFTLHKRFGWFPFSWEEYLTWVNKLSPVWFALWDVPGDPVATQKLVEAQAASGGIPTCQGTKPSEYGAHAADLKGFPLIGVGNLVKAERPDLILDAVLTVLPDVKLHLWGCGLRRLKALSAFDAHIQSTDSSAWNGRFGSGIEEYKRGREAGYSQRDYAVNIMLKKYKEKIDNWYRTPKQMRLL